VCLGAGARAANEQARRNYKYQLEQRERNWFQTLSLTSTERIMHEMGIDASNIAVNQVLGDLDVKFQKEIGTALQEDQVTWKKFLQKDTGATKLATSGVTGRSAARIGTLELGEYLAKGSRKAYELTESRQELDKAGQKAVNMAKAEQMNSFAKNNIIRNPDLAPPQPVMQNVGMAALMDGLSIAGSLMGIGTGIAGINAAGGVGAWLSGGVSDRRLKENIKKIGESKSGLGIYKFNYIGQVKQYIGTMADEVIKVVPEAVVRMSNGYFGVRYDLIDVTFKEVTP